ncbi:MAG: ion transporter [Ruminococcus sp.]|nr:ion transporter [Ruminococcus sp.]
MKDIKKRTFQIISIGQRGDLPSKVFDITITLTILANIATMLLGTFEEFNGYSQAFKLTELVTVFIFAIEYILRIWTADLLYPKLSPAKAKLRFLVSFDGMVDLLTILPFVYLSGFIVFRILRVARIFHLFRINTGSDSFAVIVSVIIEKKNQIFSSLFIIIVLMIASSLGIYSAEHEAQPEAFNNAFSGMWWSISALLTVGYGDIYPITAGGRIMGMIIALLGVGVVAIPTGIISAGFVERYSKEANKEKGFTDLNELGEILANEKNGLVGMLISDIERDHGARVFMVIRDDLTIIARSELKIKKGDILIINSEKLKKH